MFSCSHTSKQENIVDSVT